MIILSQDITNTATATCSVNKQLSSPTYLWSMRHKLTNRSWKFIPYRIPPSVAYNPSYDLFEIEVDYNKPEVFIYSAGTPCNLHLYSGDYFVKIYEQVSTTNLNPQLSYDVVYETTARLDNDTDTYTEIAYTGTTDTFKVYKG